MEKKKRKENEILAMADAFKGPISKSGPTLISSDSGRGFSVACSSQEIEERKVLITSKGVTAHVSVRNVSQCHRRKAVWLRQPAQVFSALKAPVGPPYWEASANHKTAVT